MYFQYVLEAEHTIDRKCKKGRKIIHWVGWSAKEPETKRTGRIFFEISLPVTKFNPNILRKIVGPLSCFPKLNDRLSLSDPHSLFAGGGDVKDSVHAELYMVG